MPNFHASGKYIGNIFSAIVYSVHYRTKYRLGYIIHLTFAKSDSASHVQPVGVRPNKINGMFPIT